MGSDPITELLTPFEPFYDTVIILGACLARGRAVVVGVFLGGNKARDHIEAGAADGPGIGVPGEFGLDDDTVLVVGIQVAAVAEIAHGKMGTSL